MSTLPTSVGLGGDGDEIIAIDDVERVFGVELDKGRAAQWHTAGDVFASLCQALPADHGEDDLWSRFTQVLTDQTGVDPEAIEKDSPLLSQSRLWVYVANDPVNGIDPTGMECWTVNGNVRCRLSGRPSSKSGQARHARALRAYTQAAAKANAAAKNGSSYTLKGYRQGSLQRENVQVPASQIRDSLFKSPATYVDEVNTEALASHESYAGNTVLQINKNGLDDNQSELVRTIIHEGVHNTLAEGEQKGRTPVTGRGHKESYDSVAKELDAEIPDRNIKICTGTRIC